MNWHKFIGVDTDLLKKVDPKHNERQTYILSSLTFMLIVIALICFISSIVFSLIIFHSWLVAFFVSVFLALVVFNLYRLFVMTALDVSGSPLEPYYLDHEKHYQEHINLENDFSGYSNEKIKDIVAVAKHKLREKTEVDFPTKNKTHVLTMSLRIIILSVIALVFCNGIELLMFKKQINEVILNLLHSYQSKNESWIVQHIFTPTSGDSFYMINTNSLLLALDILNDGLGYWKVLLDLLFIVLFLLPLIIVFKSKEIKKSEYVRELALSELSITFYHNLQTQKFCKKIIDEIKLKKIYYHKPSKNS